MPKLIHRPTTGRIDLARPMTSSAFNRGTLLWLAGHPDTLGNGRWTDLSGYGAHGQFNANMSRELTPGVRGFGVSPQFDSPHVIADEIDLILSEPMVNVGSSHSFLSWVYSRNTTRQTILGPGPDSDRVGWWVRFPISTNRLQIFDGTTQQAIDSGGSSQNEWVCHAYTANPSANLVTFYRWDESAGIYGQNNQNAATISVTDSDEGHSVGAWNSGNSDEFEGSIGEIRVWNRVLSGEELLAYMLEGPSGWPQSLRRRSRIFWVGAGAAAIVPETATLELSGLSPELPSQPSTGEEQLASTSPELPAESVTASLQASGLSAAKAEAPATGSDELAGNRPSLPAQPSLGPDELAGNPPSIPLSPSTGSDEISGDAPKIGIEPSTGSIHLDSVLSRIAYATLTGELEESGPLIGPEISLADLRVLMGTIRGPGVAGLTPESAQVELAGNSTLLPFVPASGAMEIAGGSISILFEPLTGTGELAGASGAVVYYPDTGLLELAGETAVLSGAAIVRKRVIYLTTVRKRETDVVTKRSRGSVVVTVRKREVQV